MGSIRLRVNQGSRERWRDFGRFLVHPTMLAFYVFAYLLGMLSRWFF